MKYNYDSWLKGEIKEDIVVLMELKQELSREDFNKIKKAQRWTFNQAVKYSLEYHKRIFELQKTDKQAEIKITEREINKDEKIQAQVLRKQRDTLTITGKQYLEVKSEVERCERAKQAGKQAGFDTYLNENERITVLYQYLQYLRKPKARKKELKYTELFKDKKIAHKVKVLFETTEYTTNGKWQGISGNHSELLAAYYVLKDKNLLNPGKITPQAKAFYKEFVLNVFGYISERTLRNEPFNKDREEFERIFEHL